VSIVFAAVAPHGGIIFPEEGGDVAAATHAGMEELGRRFAAAEPEAVVVFTPHNVHVEGHFAVVTSAWLDGGQPVALHVPVDRDLALACLEQIDGALAVSYGGNDPAEAEMPLDWGTSIPLSFLRDVPAVVISPARELPAEAHIAAGRAVAEAAGERPIAIVASADHGHAHDPDGPYGFDPAAAEYDGRIVEAISKDRLGELVTLDPAFVAAAKADSWWQLLMLQGAIGGLGLEVELLSYEAPTYFGMACAAWTVR
jgi:aromatic ring-opening dioxygenase LigB subunit